MKGILKKTDKGWMVLYTECLPHRMVKQFSSSLPLHPDDVNQIKEDSKIFDNIEARIAAYPEVEFEIKYYCDETMEQPIDVAKLIELGDEKKLNLQTLGTKLDQSLSEETDWTLSMWLKSKREQKELLSKIMEEDEKDGLYENDVDKLGNEDVQKLGFKDNIEELASKHYPEYYSFGLGVDRIGFERGHELGCKLSKENLYTEEDIDTLLSFYTDNAPASYIKRDYKKYQLKQIKNKK